MIYPMLRIKGVLKVKGFVTSDESASFLKFSGRTKNPDVTVEGFIQYDEKTGTIDCERTFINSKTKSSKVVKNSYSGISDMKNLTAAVSDITACKDEDCVGESAEKQTKFCFDYAYLDENGNIQEATRCFDTEEEANKCAERLKASVGEDKIKKSEIKEIQVSEKGNLSEGNVGPTLFTDDKYIKDKIVELLDKHGISVDRTNNSTSFYGETVDKANNHLDCCGEFSVSNGHVRFDVSFVYDGKEVSGNESVNAIYNETFVDNIDPVDVQIERIVEDNIEYGGDIKSAVGSF